MLETILVAAGYHPLLVALVIPVGLLLYQTLLHPLARVRGPLLAKITPLWLWYHSYTGDEASTVDRLHERYGPVVRVGPNDVDISAGAALQAIYTDKGGFLKAPCYANFDIDGHHTIFSALDPAHRATRAKPVISLFSPSAIRANGREALEDCTTRFVQRLSAMGDRGGKWDILDLTRSLAVDAVTSYLFQKSYGGLDERKQGEPLSASKFVDSFVEVGRLFLVPNWMFSFFDAVTAKLKPDGVAATALEIVGRYATALAEEADRSDDTFQARLLRAGITKHEVAAQCKDLIFAGTDTTGAVMANICWQLSKNPEQYAELRKEVLSAEDPEADPQTLPYLRAVVREGLRIARANPTRLPRVVPPGGWSFGGHYFPANTTIGCQISSMHFDKEIFPDPHAYKPERWLRPTGDMQRNYIAFGQGSRVCIARNLATAELCLAVRKIAEADALRGSKPYRDVIEIDEWFNSKVKGQMIELEWSRG